MHQPEVGGHFFVAAHRVGHAGTGAQAGQRRANERQEHGRGLDEHEGAPGAVTAEQPRADNHHHVAQRRARGAGVRQGVAVVQEIVRGEVFQQVAERALNRQREQHGPRHIAPGILRLLAHGRDRFESNQDQNRDAGLDEDEVETVRRDDRCGGGVEIEGRIPFVILGNGFFRLVADVKRGGELHIRRGLAILVGHDRRAVLALRVHHLQLIDRQALRIDQRLALVVERRSRLAICAEHGLRYAFVVFHDLLRDLIIDRNPVGQVVAARILRVVHPIRDGNNAEDQQCGNLDHIDGRIHPRGAVHAAKRDVGNAKGEHDAKQEHEQRTVVASRERVREKLVQQIAAENRRHAHHATGINPVIQVRRPASHKLCQPGKFVGLGFRQEGLLRIQVRRSGARKQLGQFGVTDRRGEAQQQRPENAKPHGTTRHGRAVQRLHLEGQPEKRARRNQRHGVRRQPC